MEQQEKITIKETWTSNMKVIVKKIRNKVTQLFNK